VTRPGHIRRLLLLIVLACVLPVGSAQAAHRENIASATIEQDGGRASDFAWDVSRQRGGTVDHHNAARAAARCVDCNATAIAFQIVIASRAHTVAPINEAVALNLECERCVVAAEARQFVRVMDAPVRLTGQGRHRLADVRATLGALAEQNLPVDQLHEAVEQQESRVRTILAEELVLKSDPSEQADVLSGRVIQDTDLD
jgi:hypothetical protein